MSELEKAARQALEALAMMVAVEWQPAFTSKEYDSDDPAENKMREFVLTAISALRRALEQETQSVNATGGPKAHFSLAEQPAQHECTRSHPHENMNAMCELRTEIARLKAAQQEPVAWITQNGKGWLRWHRPEDNNKDSVPLYTRPQPAAQFAGSYGTIDESAAKRIATALGWKPAAQWVHATPWRGLTDEEIALVCAECAASAHRHDDISYARAIEAKLREKNGGKA